MYMIQSDVVIHNGGSKISHAMDPIQIWNIFTRIVAYEQTQNHRSAHIVICLKKIILERCKLTMRRNSRAFSRNYDLSGIELSREATR